VDDVTTTRGRRALLALYPAPWRERYGDEVLGFLDDEFAEDRLPARVLADLMSSAIVERSGRLFEAPGNADGTDATRGLRLLAWGWCSCAVGGIGFAKLTEHFDTARFFDRGLPGGAAIASGAFGVVEVLAVLAALLVAAFAVPALLVAVAQGGGTTRRRLLVASVVALVATAVTASWLGYLVVWAHELSAAQRNGGDTAYGLAVTGLAVGVASSLAAWTAVATRALHDVRPAHRGVRVAWVARGAAGCIALVAVGAGLWWAAVGVDAPGFFGEGSRAAGLTTEWPLVLLAISMLAGGAALAVLGAWRTRGTGGDRAVLAKT
jgi:hypothetical protein